MLKRKNFKKELFANTFYFYKTNYDYLFSNLVLVTNYFCFSLNLYTKQNQISNTLYFLKSKIIFLQLIIIRNMCLAKKIIRAKNLRQKY